MSAIEALERLTSHARTAGVGWADDEIDADLAFVRAVLAEGAEAVAFADLVRSTFTSCCEENCNLVATWRSGVYPWVCDEHLGEWRASDEKAASKGSPNAPFIEVEEANIARALNRLGPGRPEAGCAGCGSTRAELDGSASLTAAGER